MTRTILAAMPKFLADVFSGFVLFTAGALFASCQLLPEPPPMVVYTQCHTGDGIAEACVERADGAYLLPDCEWLTIKMVSRDYCLERLQEDAE